jgi:hypothetical protein
MYAFKFFVCVALHCSRVQAATSNHKLSMQARISTLKRTALARPQARFSPLLSATHIAFRPTRYVPRPPHRVARQRCPYSTSNKSFADPTRPDLHYHLVDPPTPLSSNLPAFALSFLPAPPSNSSSTVLGWLPAATESSDHEAGLNDFRENSERLYTLFSLLFYH